MYGACEGEHTNIIKLMISKGANNWDMLSDSKDLELYKLYIKQTGNCDNKHLNKLICFYDPVYYLLCAHYTQTSKSSAPINRLPVDLFRMLKSFV
jgi:hypothetical protein